MIPSKPHLPVSKTPHAQIMFIPRCQTQHLSVAARQVTFRYPGDGHTPWLPLAESNEEGPWGTIPEHVLGIYLLDKPLNGPMGGEGDNVNQLHRRLQITQSYSSMHYCLLKYWPHILCHWHEFQRRPLTKLY